MSESHSGGSSALRILLQALEPQFRRISSAYQMDAADAEDALQNTLLRFTPHRAMIPNPAGWLPRVFRRECLRQLRKCTRRAEICVDPKGIDKADSAAPVLSPDERLHLAVSIEQLSPRHRKVLWLRYALGLSEAEVAEALGCRSVSAKKAIARALEALRGSFLQKPAL